MFQIIVEGRFKGPNELYVSFGVDFFNMLTIVIMIVLFVLDIIGNLEGGTTGLFLMPLAYISLLGLRIINTEKRITKLLE